MAGLERFDFSYYSKLVEKVPVEAEAFDAVHATADREGGVISAKYRQLTALAVALTTQYPLCIESYSAKTRKAGVTPEVVSELILVAGAVRAGGTVAHGLLALRCCEKSKALT